MTLVGAVALVPHGGTEARGAAFPTARLETGRLLVARPGMVDANFSQTVVLLLHYGPEGALGVIVNRPTSVVLSDALPGVEPLAERPETVFRGGPMALDRLLFMFRTATPRAGCQPVLPDVCASGSLEILEQSLDDERSTIDFRGFAGYSGWAPGQLDWEIEQHRWYVVPGDGERVFRGATHGLWSELVRLAESPVA